MKVVLEKLFYDFNKVRQYLPFTAKIIFDITSIGRHGCKISTLRGWFMDA